METQFGQTGPFFSGKGRAAVPWLAAAAMLGLSTSASAGDGTDGYTLSYDAYVSGLRAFSATFDLIFDDAGYAARVEVETSGLVSTFVDWRLEAATLGLVDAGKVQPQRHRAANYRGERERWVAIDYGGEGPMAVRSKPAASEDERARVPKFLMAGTVDPMSALTQTLLLTGDDEICPAETQIFDGRRRYDLMATEVGSKMLKASRYAPYHGDAEGCSLTFRRIAGFKERETSNDNALSSDATMWLAEVVPGATPVPVRLEVEGSFGTVLVHLKKAALAEGTVVFGEGCATCAEP